MQELIIRIYKSIKYIDMGNMSYCRFENTLRDLRDCYKDLSETDFYELSETEQEARNKLVALCKEISEQFEEEEMIEEDY